MNRYWHQKKMNHCLCIDYWTCDYWRINFLLNNNIIYGKHRYATHLWNLIDIFFNNSRQNLWGESAGYPWTRILASNDERPFVGTFLSLSCSKFSSWAEILGLAKSMHGIEYITMKKAVEPHIDRTNKNIETSKSLAARVTMKTTCDCHPPGSYPAAASWQWTSGRPSSHGLSWRELKGMTVMIILTGAGWWIISQMRFIFGWWFLDTFWMLNWNSPWVGACGLMFLWRRLQTYIANPRIRSPSVFAHAWQEAGWTQGGLGCLRPTWHFCNLSSVNRWLENHLKASGDCRTRYLASCWSSCEKSSRPKFFEAHVRTSWLERPTSENNTLLNQCWLWRTVDSKS